MEKIVEQTLLYDFYGELLTEHQRQIYEDVIFNDLSLSEAAQERGISRQGVHDMIRRCSRILQGYEEKLGITGLCHISQHSIRAGNDGRSCQGIGFPSLCQREYSHAAFFETGHYRGRAGKKAGAHW